MTPPKNPAEIARETLKRLAAGNLPPTPVNYMACYNEIANLPFSAPFPGAQLEKIVARLPIGNTQQEKSVQAMQIAIARRSWQSIETALLAFVSVAVDKKTVQSFDETALPPGFALQLAAFLENVLPAFGDKGERGPQMISRVVQHLRKPPVGILPVQDLLSSTAPQTLVSAEEQGQVKTSLLKLMRLLLENIGHLTLDESWLKGQVEGLLAVIEPPVSLRQIDDMERRLREVIIKQSEARRQSIKAREEMRNMLASFVESLATMNESSASFQEKIESSATKIKMVKEIEELSPLLKDVIEATRVMSEDTSQARNQLKGMQDKVEATEAALARLYEELDSASTLARHDALTDALNRKGLDEALEREMASLRRSELPLSISLLDIDNFKKLNDRLGHEAGDKALVHLASVARQCMRPNDTLARYGGEEFVILMPDTPLASGIEAMTRLQRELTRIFFLSGKENVLITFSAGVVQVEPDETGVQVLSRADQAMYLAKRAGKNRVMGG